MTSFHHKSIKRFYLDGNIQDDSVIPRLKSEYLKLLESEMRLAGYVQKLEIDPDFTISYNVDKEYFEFRLSIYGIYVGRKQSECIQGIDGTRVIYIQQSRSKESFQDQASRSNLK